MPPRRALSLLLALPIGIAMSLPVAAEAVADRQSSAQVEKINYPGYGIAVERGSGDQRRLKGAPRSLKRFVKARLDVLFGEAGSKPRCATSPIVTVDRYDSRGFAAAGEGWGKPCAAGGYSIIYSRTGSGWQAVLGAQDVRSCQDLAWWGVPSFIGGRQCLSEDMDVVRYEPDGETVSPEATTRRVISLLTEIPIVPQDRVINAAALAQLESYVSKGTYLTLDECVVDGAQTSCVVDAMHKDGSESQLVLAMEPIGEDLVVTEVRLAP